MGAPEATRTRRPRPAAPSSPVTVDDVIERLVGFMPQTAVSEALATTADAPGYQQVMNPFVRREVARAWLLLVWDAWTEAQSEFLPLGAGLLPDPGQFQFVRRLRREQLQDLSRRAPVSPQAAASLLSSFGGALMQAAPARFELARGLTLCKEQDRYVIRSAA